MPTEMERPPGTLLVRPRQDRPREAPGGVPLPGPGTPSPPVPSRGRSCRGRISTVPGGCSVSVGNEIGHLPGEKLPTASQHRRRIAQGDQRAAFRASITPDVAEGLSGHQRARPQRRRTWWRACESSCRLSLQAVHALEDHELDGEPLRASGCPGRDAAVRGGSSPGCNVAPVG